MTKATILILLCLCLSVLAQLPSPGPRCRKGTTAATCNYRLDSDQPGIPSDNSDESDALENAGQCRIRLYANGAIAYSRILTSAASRHVRPTLSAAANNNIDAISYSGLCYCWVNLFNGQNYGGVNLGLWLDNDDDEIYLSDYRTFVQSTRQWVQWDRITSSYWIDCYFN